MPAGGWQKDDRIDWLLFKAQLETAEFFDRVYGLPFTDFLELDRGDPITSGSVLAD